MNDDTSKEIDALECKSNPEHFERLFNYLVARQAARMALTPQQLYEQVAEADLRGVVRKAVDRFRPAAKSITKYSSWSVRQLVHRRLAEARGWRG